MESPAEAAANGPSPRNFSQVVFIDIPHSYPPATPVTCRYTLTEALTPNSRDWVGIFKVGWSTTKDYHTFVWAEPSSDVAGPESMTRQAVFKDYYLPKDEIEFYQFCYVDSTGQVRGASTPFCFRNPVEQSMESSLDDDLLVITTQEQVEQSVQKIAELQNVLDQKKEENETLQRALLKERQESANVKMQKEQYEEEKTRLARDSDQIKEENKDLKSKLQQQMEEMDRLKEEVLIQRTKQMEIEERFAAEQKKMSQNLRSDEALRQNEKQIQEKYDRAVMKINQLKEEREELKGKVNALSEEISTLSFKIREKDRELFKMRDSIQLMQVDLQSSEKEKERLSAEMQSLEQRMEDMRREAQELAMRRPQQETQQSSANNELREQCQTLTSQLQDAKAKLAAEKEVSKNAKRRAEFLDGELQQLRMQLEALSSSYDQAQQRNSKQELLLREAHEAIADKEVLMEEKNHMIELVTQERDELARENQNLSGDLEELRRALTNIQSAPPAESLYMRPDDITAAGNLETPGQAEHVYDSIGNPEQEQSLVCGHCQESFPGITREELEAHEQSHRICPFCSMICDAMEQSVFEDHVYGHEL